LQSTRLVSRVAELGSLADFARMERKRSVDWMCIGIEKIADTDADAQYAFVSDVYEPDPRFRGRMMIVGQNRGVLRVTKATGEVTLVEAMPEDDGEKRFTRAAAKIRKHWEAREFPDKTMFACG
jgi:hypothetical protein